MVEKKWPELEKDFENWSGGFPPESEYQVIVYLDYANAFRGREAEVREYLINWYKRGDPDFKDARGTLRLEEGNRQ